MFGNISIRKRMFEKNKKYWDKRKSSNRMNEGWICVYHSLAYHLELSMLEDLIAKGIQKKEKLPIVAFSYGDGNEAFTEGDLSFGIEAKQVGYCDNSFWSRIRVSIMVAWHVVRTYQKRDRLLSLKYRGVSCGNAIWDQVVWIEQCNNFKQISKKQYKECITDAFNIIERATKEFSKYTPKYLVIDEWGRVPAVWANVAAHLGATIVRGGLDYANYIYKLTGKKITGEGMCSQIQRKELEDAILKKPLSTMKETFLYKMNGEKLAEDYENIPLGNGKKNVFIMLSGFSDVPRYACRHRVYRDYVEWFEDTLQIVSNIDGVNWIVRNHPFTAGNPQEKFVNDTCEIYKDKNIYLCSSSLSREEIIKSADCIITYAGDVGIEYWALGIPTITLGEAYYVPFGISYNMKTRDEYKNVLEDIDKLKSPVKEQKEMAQKLLIALQSKQETKDELANLFRDVHSKEYQGIQYEQRAYDLYDLEFCEKYMRLLDEDKVYGSACVELENVICCELE